MRERLKALRDAAAPLAQAKQDAASRPQPGLVGALRAWRAQGITTIDAARKQGQLEGSNIVMTERPGAQPPAASAQKDLFNRDWAAMFDEEG